MSDYVYASSAGQPTGKVGDRRLAWRARDEPKTWLTRYWPEARSYRPAGYPYGDAVWKRRYQYVELACITYREVWGQLVARIVLSAKLTAPITHRYAVAVDGGLARSVTYYVGLVEAQAQYDRLSTMYHRAGYTVGPDSLAR